MSDPHGVVVDVRALQAHDHASRGIGRYTLELIRAVERRRPDLVRAYVADPAFPMHQQCLRLLGTDKLRRSDDPELVAEPPAVLHLSSPFVEGAAEAVMVPPFAGAHTTRLVATAYDLIPLRFPEIYLADEVAARRYRARVALLRSCDRLLSISQATTSDLVDLAGVHPSRIVTVHGAAGGEFVPGAMPRGSFVLCPSGAEWRKNLDRLLQAWRLVDPAIRALHPLVVQCHLSDDAREHLQARSRELGIEDSVEFTGAVGDRELVRLMQTAELVVFPSLYEGLGLPVLEARRCGAAVVCGDNSSLAELVEDPSARFDAEDPADIAAVLERHLGDPDLLERRRNEPVAQRYSWDSVADAATAVYDELQERPSVHVTGPDPSRSRRRLAVASPVPPQMSGPSAYLHEFLRHLPELCDLTLFTSIDPALVDVPDGVRVERIGSLDMIEATEGRFDEVLYFIGNSEHHIAELAQLRRRPGVVFLHDARLTILYSEMYRTRPELMGETFGAALHRMYPGRYPAPMGGAQYLPLPEEGLYGVLMIADVAELATRLMVHSSHAADLIELDCGRRPEVMFPIPSARTVPQPPSPATAADVVISSFGFVSPAKRSELLVEAVATRTDARLALIGHSGDEYLEALRREAARHGAAERVTVTGKVDDGEYRSWLGRTSIAVQLRLFSNGESSASVAETLAAGIPTVVTDIGTFAEYPDDVVVKVPVDISVDGLASLLDELSNDVERRRALSAASVSYAQRNSYERAAKLLVDALLGPVEVGSAPSSC